VARIITVVFLVLHGLVHLLYLGQAAKVFELQPGLSWPSGSWLFSRALGEGGTRTLACVLCALTALGFVMGAAGLLLDHTWWRSAVVGTAAFSVLLYIMFWNGRVERLDQQGVVGILLDAAILVIVLIFKWP
jgi:hypothetical protein